MGHVSSLIQSLKVLNVIENTLPYSFHPMPFLKMDALNNVVEPALREGSTTVKLSPIL